MHEKYIEGITVGVVAGLIVFWLSNARRKYGFQTTSPQAYQPLTGDVRRSRGMGTCACCQCCGLPVPENTTVPLASDYLDCTPEYKPPISEWNLGVSINTRCGLDAKVYADKMAASPAYGIAGPNTVPATKPALNPLTCNPNVPGEICCTEIV